MRLICLLECKSILQELKINRNKTLTSKQASKEKYATHYLPRCYIRLFIHVIIHSTTVSASTILIRTNVLFHTVVEVLRNTSMQIPYLHLRSCGKNLSF